MRIWRAIATLAILRPRRLAIRSNFSRSGPEPVVIFWAASTSAQRSAGEPWREMWPRRALPSELRTVGRQAGPGAEVAGGREAGDVADLGDDQQRGVAADAADLAEHVDAVVVAGALVDLAGGVGDLAVEVVDQRHQAVQPPPRRVAQLERGEELAAALAEQVGVLVR